MKNKFVALFLGWLVPGLGHWYAGQRWRAAVVFIAIVGAATAGLALGSGRNVYFSWSSPFSAAAAGPAIHWQFFAEIGNGLFTVAASVLMRATHASPIEYTATGGALAGILPVADLYLMVAGLLNFIAAANAFDTVARAREAKKA